MSDADLFTAHQTTVTTTRAGAVASFAVADWVGAGWHSKAGR